MTGLNWQACLTVFIMLVVPCYLFGILAAWIGNTNNFAVIPDQRSYHAGKEAKFLMCYGAQQSF